MVTFKDFRNQVKPNWCPGCGDFSVQASIQRAAANLGLTPENLVIVSGIGCSGRISGYIYAYGFHGVHGRSLPIAQGLKLANRDLTVIAAGGDGDGFAIGLGHTIHAMRRNMDITYLVMDNQVYGLTKGQTSPRSEAGFVTQSTPAGSIDQPISPLEIALASGATFVAQGFSSNVEELTSLIEEGIRHKGFSFINVFSPCVTYNKVNTYQWFKSHLKSVNEMEYDPYDRQMAMKTVMETGGLITGLIYQNKNQPSYEDLLSDYRKQPLTKTKIELTGEEFHQLIAEFM